MLEDEIFEAEFGNKVVIFSQFIEPLQFMFHRFKKYHPLIIDGSVPPEKRQQLTLLFNDPDSIHKIMLGQTIACGEGINLDGANIAILFDLLWNEATHQQAFKRIRRMTQKRRQYFIYLVVENTIENKILSIIERKQRVFEGVVGEGGGADGSKFGMEDLEDLLFNSGRTQSRS